jgi:asparagine synthase (glutamine-hydrolysing)
LNKRTVANHAFELINQAVERRLIADVPIGLLLSGGMDSSTLLALMRLHTSEPIHTYSVGFNEPSFNELPYARIMADRFGCIHQEVVVDAAVARELLPICIGFIDEPYADGSAIPTYCVCRLAKNDVVVVLSGEGGDEAFAGYETYAAFKAAAWFRRVPAWIRRGVIAPSIRALPVSDKKLSLEFRLKRFLGGYELEPSHAHLWWRIVLTEEEKRLLYTPQVLASFKPLPSVRHFEEAFACSPADDTLGKLMHMDSSLFLPDDLMIKNDRMSMAHSLEARVPMTDPELVEFMSQVPSRLKLPGLRTKQLLRSAMREVLPQRILNKKKVGLEMPYSRWLKEDLRDLMEQYLGPGRLAETGLFRQDTVAKLTNDHLIGVRDNGRILWGLLNYMIWLELYQPSVEL